MLFAVRVFGVRCCKLVVVCISMSGGGLTSNLYVDSHSGKERLASCSTLMSTLLGLLAFYILGQMREYLCGLRTCFTRRLVKELLADVA